MKYTETLARIGAESVDGWALYRRARRMITEGRDVVELAIGEPDVPVPDTIVHDTVAALRRGRTGYASGAGELELRTALATRYSAAVGRPIGPDQVLCFPGTQTALYTVVRATAGTGDDILIGDPMYATYQPVATASGARVIPVPLRPECDFRIQAADVERRITPRTTALLLNTPHNPTGAVLTENDIADLGDVAAAHDLWILVDEVYEQLVFDGVRFHSPLARPDLAERVVVVNSISKSHAAPGLRSGWCVASEEFCHRTLPLSEAVLFGNQPFIADATAAAVAQPSPVAKGMVDRFERRAARLADLLHRETSLRVHLPRAGMFALVDVSSYGLDGDTYASSLLEEGGVAVMPGSSFGTSLSTWVRVALTRSDDVFDRGSARIVDHARNLAAAAHR